MQSTFRQFGDTSAFIRFAHSPLIGEFARMLNACKHTLKRRLMDEGMCFRTLPNMARLSRANALIRESRMLLTQIAADLRISEPTSVSRAYKKSTGVAPSKAKPELRGYRESR